MTESSAYGLMTTVAKDGEFTEEEKQEIIKLLNGTN